MKVIIHEQNKLEEAWFSDLKAGAQSVAGDVKNYAAKKVQAGREGGLKADVPKALNNISAQLTKAAQDLQNLSQRSVELKVNIGNVKQIINSLNSANNKIKNSKILASRQVAGQEAQPSAYDQSKARVANMVAQRNARIAADQQASEPEVAANPNASAENPEPAIGGTPAPAQAPVATSNNQINKNTGPIFDSFKEAFINTYASQATPSIKSYPTQKDFLTKYKQYINNALNTGDLGEINQITKADNLRDKIKNAVKQYLVPSQETELEESHSKPSFKIKIGEAC
jgi:hypothetical protein